MTLDESFNAHRAQMGENDLYIWNYISQHRETCATLSIQQLGERCNVSRTTILRFARKLGLHGFSELKTLLRMEHAQACQLPPNYIDRTCLVYQTMMSELRTKDYSALFAAIDQAENLYVYSSGMLQDAVAKELCRVFLTGGKLLYAIHAGTEGDVLLHNVTPRDLVIILSVSGESRHVLQLAQALKVRHIPTVSITRRRENSLAQLCDQQLYALTVELNAQVLGTQYQSTTSFFILAELQFLKYMEYRNGGIDGETGNTD